MSSAIIIGERHSSGIPLVQQPHNIVTTMSPNRNAMPQISNNAPSTRFFRRIDPAASGGTYHAGSLVAPHSGQMSSGSPLSS